MRAQLALPMKGFLGRIARIRKLSTSPRMPRITQVYFLNFAWQIAVPYFLDPQTQPSVMGKGEVLFLVRFVPTKMLEKRITELQKSDRSNWLWEIDLGKRNGLEQTKGGNRQQIPSNRPNLNVNICCKNNYRQIDKSANISVRGCLAIENPKHRDKSKKNVLAHFD